MTDRVELRDHARAHLAAAVQDAIRAAMDSHDFPDLVLTAAPMVLTGLAGSYVLQFARTGRLNDGETDKLLAGLDLNMRNHADPVLNPPTGQEPPSMHAQRSPRRG